MDSARLWAVIIALVLITLWFIGMWWALSSY